MKCLFSLFIGLNLYCFAATARCLDHDLPPASASIDDQTSFLNDVIFAGDLASCSSTELTTIRSLLIKDLNNLKVEYPQESRMNKMSLMAVAANFKATIAMIDGAIARLSPRTP